MRNRVSLGGLLAAVILIGVSLPARSQQPERDEAPPVAGIKVEKCSVKLIDEVTLSAERGGILAKIDVREGQSVKEGDLVALIKDDVPRATLAIAEEEASSRIEIDFAEKAAEVALAEYEKARDANERFRGTVPEVEVRRAKLAHEKALLEIKKAEHVHEVNKKKRDEAFEQLQMCRIVAPFDGFVSRVHPSRGALVKPGDQVVEILSTATMKVEGFVTLSEAIELAAAMRAARDAGEKSLSVKVRATGSQSNREFDGELAFIDVKVTQVDNRVRVWAEVQNADGDLRAGQNATMMILPKAGR